MKRLNHVPHSGSFSQIKMWMAVAIRTSSNVIFQFPFFISQSD